MNDFHCLSRFNIKCSMQNPQNMVSQTTKISEFTGVSEKLKLKNPISSQVSLPYKITLTP